MALPVTMTSEGALPTDVSTIRDTLDTAIGVLAPGYTSNLPGTLVEDILSTDTAAVAACDQARVDCINSIPATTVNEYLLDQLGACRGITRNSGLNSRAYVQFSGPVGLVIPVGFRVSDGTYVYETISSTVITSSGSPTSLSLAVSTTSGTWEMPIGSINQVVTQPSQGTVTVSNPAIGIAYEAESSDDYRSRVLSASSMGPQGSPSYLKSKLASVAGVIPRSISVSTSGQGIIACVAGGDVYDIAQALYEGIGDPTALRGSVISVSGASLGNPCTITTNVSHNLATGSTVTIEGALGMTSINGSFTATVTSDTTFTIPVDTSSSNPYLGGGYLTNNLALQQVTLYEGSDSFTIPFMLATPQAITMDITWSVLTSLAATDSDVSSDFKAAAVNYINGLSTGSYINLQVLKNQLSSSLPGDIIDGFTSLSVLIYVDGVQVSPTEGDLVIKLGQFRYPTLTTDGVTVTQS